MQPAVDMASRKTNTGLVPLARDAAVDWYEHNTFRLAASLAFYTIFSLAPLLVIAIAVAGAVFGEEVATRKLLEQINGLVGTEGAAVVRDVLENANRSPRSTGAAILGLVTLIIGSTAVFAELQAALNLIWGVQSKPTRGAIVGLVLSRVTAFAVVLGVGFLLLVSLAASAVLAAAQEYLAENVLAMPEVWRALNVVVSFGLTTGLFMLIYKLLPDVRLRWGDVAVGAAVTAVLFTIGKFMIGEYLGRVSVGSSYGAAGSFAVLLIWIYYSALISFYGAEFTHVYYCRRQGNRVETESHAEPTPGAAVEGARSENTRAESMRA